MAAVTKIGVSWSLLGTEKKRENPRQVALWQLHGNCSYIAKKKKKDLGTIYSDINCDGDRSDIWASSIMKRDAGRQQKNKKNRMCGW